MRAFFVSQSKRVSQLEDGFANDLGAIDEFFFHGGRSAFRADMLFHVKVLIVRQKA